MHSFSALPLVDRISDEPWGEDLSDEEMDCSFDFAGYATEEAVVDGVGQTPADQETMDLDEVCAWLFRDRTFCLTFSRRCVIAATRRKSLANHYGPSEEMPLLRAGLASCL